MTDPSTGSGQALIEDLLDDAERHIHNVLIKARRDGLIPLCVMRGRNGKTILCPMAWQSDEEKAFMVAVLGAKMRQEGVRAYCIMSEAWIAVQPKGWKPGDPLGDAPSERPDRKEVVFALACDKKRSSQREWRIVRGEAGTIVKLVRQTAVTIAMAGRMAEMLR